MEGSEQPTDSDEQSVSGVIDPSHGFLYLQVQSDLGTPIPTALFTKEVITGMCVTQYGVSTVIEPPLEVFLLTDSEVVIGMIGTDKAERMMVKMLAIDWWLDQKVTLQCRVATQIEVIAARAKAIEEEEDGHPSLDEDEGDTRLLQLMNGIHKLTTSPHGEALRIPTFSGVVPIPKNEATYAQWIHEVKQALDRFPETTVRNWISRSLRGTPAETVRSLGPGATVQTILQKLEMMHGAVYPLDVMMRRIFSIVQAPGESVTHFAIKLESAVSDMKRDHPMRTTRINLEGSMRDRFYHGLKKPLRESLRYLYNTGAPYEAILIAARTTEAEAENFKETDVASARSVQEESSDLLDEVVNIKTVVKKTWNSQQKAMKKRGQAGGTKQKKESGGKTKPLSLVNKGACYRCGEHGHFVRNCPNPKENSLNSNWGGNETQAPPQPETQAPSIREGLGQTTMVYINFVPYDAIVDIGSSFSMIDVILCEDLGLQVHSVTYEIPHYIGMNETSVPGSTVAILGWVKAELGIPYMGCILAKFWVTECLTEKTVPLIIGCNQAKKIFAQANLDKIDCWPKPWKPVYNWCSMSRWHEEGCSDDLYDSDDYEAASTSSGEIPPFREASSPVSSLSDSWSDIMATIELNLYDDLAEVEKKQRVSTPVTGIPDSRIESEREAYLTPSAMCGPLSEEEETKLKGSDGRSVFNSLADESEVKAEEVSDPTCNIKDLAVSRPCTVQLSPLPTVSCRITPTGETVLSFQWESSK